MKKCYTHYTIGDMCVCLEEKPDDIGCTELENGKTWDTCVYGKLCDDFFEQKDWIKDGE